IKQLPGRVSGTPTAITVSAASIQSPTLQNPVIAQTALSASPIHQAGGLQSPTNTNIGIVSSPVHSVPSPVQRIVTKVQPAKPMQTTQKVLTTSSQILQQQPTQIVASPQGQSAAQTIQTAILQTTQAQLQHQPQTIRVVATGGTAISNAQQLTTGTGTPIRVLSSTGQQLRIGTASTGTMQQAGQTAVLRTAGTGIVSGAQLQTVQQRLVNAGSGNTSTTATIGGKQIILQKPVTIVSGNPGAGTAGATSINSATTNQGQILTLVKTSQGMTMQTVPKMSVVQKTAGGTVAGTIHQPQQQIITSNLLTGAGGTVVQQATVAGTAAGQKTTVIGGNVVKLMSTGSGTIGGKQILMKNSNIVQVGKVGTNSTGKPTLVLTNKAGQAIRGNQQVIVVLNTITTTRSANIGGATVLQATSVPAVSGTGSTLNAGGTTGNIVAASVASGGTTTTIGGQAIKLRTVQGGKPITFTMPVGGLQAGGQKITGTQIINMPQKLTLDGEEEMSFFGEECNSVLQMLRQDTMAAEIEVDMREEARPAGCCLPMFTLEQLDGCDDSVVVSSDSNTGKEHKQPVRYIKPGLYGGAMTTGLGNNNGGSGGDDSDSQLENQVSDSADDQGQLQQQQEEADEIDQSGELSHENVILEGMDDTGGRDSQDEGHLEDDSGADGGAAAGSMMVSADEEEGNFVGGEDSQDHEEMSTEHDENVQEGGGEGGESMMDKDNATASSMDENMEDAENHGLDTIMADNNGDMSAGQSQQEMSFGNEQEETMDQHTATSSDIAGGEGTGDGGDEPPSSSATSSGASVVPHVPKTTVVSAPTASETEAANILTTIKSGEILSLHNAELLAGGSTGTGNENIIQLDSGTATLLQSCNENGQMITFKTEADENGGVSTPTATDGGTPATVTLSDGTTFVTRLQTPVEQSSLGIASSPGSMSLAGAVVKTEDGSSTPSSTTGHLDALAEAAASATSVLPSELMGDILSSPTSNVSQTTPQQIKFLDPTSKQFTTVVMQAGGGDGAATISNAGGIVNNGNNATVAGKSPVTGKAVVRSNSAGKTKDEKDEVRVG
uniref:Uncharacterized protein n=1 Tax=Anopheles maculatus TaxID=74869 RepID=A0A182T0S1_9DIPT